MEIYFLRNKILHFDYTENSLRLKSQLLNCYTDRGVIVFLYSFLLPGGSAGQESSCNARDQGWEDPLEGGKATHSRILAWRIPWTV